jgi:hypothetical protein
VFFYEIIHPSNSVETGNTEQWEQMQDTQHVSLFIPRAPHPSVCPYALAVFVYSLKLCNIAASSLLKLVLPWKKGQTKFNFYNSNTDYSKEAG